MKLTSLIASSLFIVAPVFGSNVPLPYSTGETMIGNVYAAGSIDSSYKALDGSPIYVIATNPGWATPNNSSAWVTVDQTNGSTVNSGSYTEDYTVSFTIPSTVNPDSVKITGLFAVDNSLDDIYVNNFSTGISSTDAWESLQGFTLDEGFVAGVNTIDFQFTNTSGAGGILVEFKSASAIAPEPASCGLIGLGLAALGLVGNKIRQS